MGEELKADAQLFQLLSNLLQQVEMVSNEEEVELRAKIEALGLEVTKVPTKPKKELNEVEIAAELERLSAKLDDVDRMVSSAMAEDPQVKAILARTADVWLPVITADARRRAEFAAGTTSGSGGEGGEKEDDEQEKQAKCN